MTFTKSNTNIYKKNRLVIWYVVTILTVLCFSLIYVMSVLNSEQMVQYTVQTSADVVFETEPGAYIDLFNIPEDGPSYTELGVVSPPSQSDTEAYNTWAESYRDAYYEYLVEIGAAEAYDVTLDQITEAERDAYTEDQKQFLEN